MPVHHAVSKLPVVFQRFTFESKHGYTGGGNSSSGDPLADKTPLCFDKPNLSTEGVTVLFIDGHVEFIEGKFKTSELFLQHLIKDRKLPNNQSTKLLNKLKKLKR